MLANKIQLNEKHNIKTKATIKNMLNKFRIDLRNVK